MYQKIVNRLKLLSILGCFLSFSCFAAAGSSDQSKIKTTVDNAIKPLRQKYDIAGIAVAVSINGKNYFYNYGVASRETQQPVTNVTLFEVGSVSKTFVATLASYAQVNGQLSLTDSVSQHLPYLRGSSFDNISLMNLGTHTAGDFPLQPPDHIANANQLMDYYKNWKPTFVAGTHRNYSNLGIGLLGVVTAKSMDMPFADAMENKLFPKLGMKHTYINVPASQMKNYAQGYDKTDAPVRVNPGILAAEAYGVKTNTVDLIRFINANMGLIKLNGKFQRAITDTHIGYFKSGEIIQDLIWEQYPNTSTLETLLAGNSMQMIFQTNVVIKLSPPLQPQMEVLINKTGSTNGFGAYALYNPAKKMGIVILANKSYPIDQRVTAAYQILTQLGRQVAMNN
ncbi:MAG: class C beta-lactamase [Pseudomonadota bacterium]